MSRLPKLDDSPLDLDPRGSQSGGLAGLFSSDADPRSSGSSSLGSLSFQRTVPPSQQPKPKPKPAAPPPSAEPAPDGPPLTLFATLVNAFQSVEGAWRPVGQAGLALVGGHEVDGGRRLGGEHPCAALQLRLELAAAPLDATPEEDEILRLRLAASHLRVKPRESERESRA